MTVRYRDGIHFESLEAGRLVVDARSAAREVNVVSHAHADHTVRSSSETVVDTHHGFDESFADTLVTEDGYRAQPLPRDQRTLAAFC